MKTVKSSQMLLWANSNVGKVNELVEPSLCSSYNTLF